MASRSVLLAPTLVMLAGATVPALALDSQGPTPTTPPSAGGGGQQVLGPNGGMIEIGPGRAQGSGRVVYIQGLVDLDAIQQGNYFDGNSSHSDHRSEGWIRAELGSRVEVDERVEVAVTVAYQGIAGSNTPTAPAGTGATTVSNGPVNGSPGNAVIDDAFVKLKEFLGYRALTVEAGRMPVSWNLRKNHSAFLYDSHADNPTITSWDGVRAQYNYDTLDLTPYAFHMPDNSSLYGVMVDWEPDNAGNNRIFFSASANLERNILLKDGTLGDKLYTYYVGADADLSDFELYGEFAMQRGNQTSDVSFAGYGLSGGIDWHPDTQVVVGIQGDYLTGDNDPTDATNHAFINKWEGVSDCFIVENEKYGELSQLLDGNLTSGKAKFEYAFDEKKRVRFKTVYGNFRISKPVPGGNRGFGQEVDLSLAWDYTHDATITLLGGGFKPGEGYVETSKAGIDAGRDWIYVMAANLRVKF